MGNTLSSFQQRNISSAMITCLDRKVDEDQRLLKEIAKFNDIENIKDTEKQDTRMLLEFVSRQIETFKEQKIKPKLVKKEKSK